MEICTVPADTLYDGDMYLRRYELTVMGDMAVATSMKGRRWLCTAVVICNYASLGDMYKWKKPMERIAFILPEALLSEDDSSSLSLEPLVEDEELISEDPLTIYDDGPSDYLDII